MSDYDQNSSDSAIINQLTAYLDGELDVDEVTKVENRLADDERYRSLMQKLQKTWDVLDVLPSSPVNKNFTQSTMKLVVDDAKSLVTQKRNTFWTWPLRILALLLVPAVASAGAIIVSKQIQNAPLEQLALELPVIKDLDILNCDQNLSIELLETLANNKSLFAMTNPERSESRLLLFQRKVKDLDSLSLLQDFEKQRISENRIKFAALETSGKTRLRKLSDELSNHPDSAKLRATLFNYFYWLNQQSSLVSAQIRDIAESDLKIKEIRRVADDQFPTIFADRLLPTDRKTLFIGICTVLDKKGELIDSSFLELYGPTGILDLTIASTKLSQKELETVTRGKQLQVIFDRNPEMIDEIVDDELVNFIKSFTLSPPARDVLEMTKNLAHDLSERQLLTLWMLESFDDFYRPPDRSKFFQSLPDEQQEKLDNEFPVDRERMIDQLWKNSHGQSL